MKNILIILFALFAINAYSQIDFENDPKSFNDIYNKHYNYKGLNKDINKKFGLADNYDFELRLWVEPAPMSGRSVFILRQKNNLWNARYFTEKIKVEGEAVSAFWKEKELVQDDLGQLWQNLRNNQILTLPTLDSIRNKMRVYYADTLYISGLNFPLSDGPYYKPYILDGVSYRIELKTQNKKRSYTYHCPRGYLKECPNVEELFRAYAIVALIFRKVGLNPNTIC